jgi:hypothetical protein
MGTFFSEVPSFRHTFICCTFLSEQDIFCIISWFFPSVKAFSQGKKNPGCRNAPRILDSLSFAEPDDCFYQQENAIACQKTCGIENQIVNIRNPVVEGQLQNLNQ